MATTRAHVDPTSRMESPREALTASLHAPRGAPRGRTKPGQPLRAHTLKTPWPLKRPTQTVLGQPARTPTDCGTCGFGEGW